MDIAEIVQREHILKWDLNIQQSGQLLSSWENKKSENAFSKHSPSLKQHGKIANIKSDSESERQKVKFPIQSWGQDKAMEWYDNTIIKFIRVNCLGLKKGWHWKEQKRFEKVVLAANICWLSQNLSCSLPIDRRYPLCVPTRLIEMSAPPGKDDTWVTRLVPSPPIYSPTMYTLEISKSFHLEITIFECFSSSKSLKNSRYWPPPLFLVLVCSSPLSLHLKVWPTYIS